MFRKFVDEDGDGAAIGGDNDAAELDPSLPSRPRGPTTRSSFKPRLLFPPSNQASKDQHNTEDEEADTDIEEPVRGSLTPSKEVDDLVATPTAPRFAPVSPPGTSRATRSKKVDVNSSPMGFTSDDEMIASQSWQSNRKATTSRTARKRRGSVVADVSEKKLRR